MYILCKQVVVNYVMLSSMSDEWSLSVVQADHGMTASSADTQLIVTPPTTINKIYKIIRTHTCHSLSHRHRLSQA